MERQGRAQALPSPLSVNDAGVLAYAESDRTFIFDVFRIFFTPPRVENKVFKMLN